VLWGLWLPAWLQDSRELHLRKPKALPPVRREGVVGHTVLAFEDETLDWEGLRISTPARTWLDLARQLPLEDLVAMGDQLLRQPRPGLELRTDPWTTTEALRQIFNAIRRCKESSRRGPPSNSYVSGLTLRLRRSSASP
jgi:hypothetical protein